ncbi:MAG: hypothetical protein H0X24_01190 [Ktedonobacterales bacterium]|nr:hypothetical protein [Ktedonobacterales bacterium]
MAMIEFEGDRVPFDEELVKTDVELKECLRPHIQRVDNLLIERTRDTDGTLLIKVRTSPGTKGGIVAVLDAAPHDPQQAVQLAQYLTHLQVIGQLDLATLLTVQAAISQALQRADEEELFARRFIQQLDVAAAIPGAWIG